MSNGSGVEDEFRAMFAERSEQVPMSAAPYSRLRTRIVATRRQRRQRVGGAFAAVVVVAAGIGAWASTDGNQGSKPGPAGSVGKKGAVRFAYADGTPISDGQSTHPNCVATCAHFRQSSAGLPPRPCK